MAGSALDALARRRWLQGAAGALLIGAGWASMRPAQAAEELSVGLEELRAALVDRRTVVFDIREPQEHATGVAAGARLLPGSQLGARLAEIPRDPAQPVLLVCNTQNRSRRAVEVLRSRGYTNVRYVTGGMSSWSAKGWPLVAPGASTAAK
jgi:rhodanese-related sulfurtransferase